MKKIIQILFILFAINANAQSAPAYYNPVDLTLRNEALKNELAAHINNTHHTAVDYSLVWEILQQTDLVPDDNQNVYLIYGWDNTNQEDDDDLWRNKYATCGNGNPCTDETWNREHVFPKALDQSNSNDSGPTADPHMLRASDVEMNGLRANREFAAGSGTPSYITNNGDFFPGDRWKGDVARIIMYMYVHYGEQWNPNFVGQGNNSFHADMPDIFLQWNAEDPVSQYEINRNNIIETYQGNRNPFIDNPYLATLIWNGPSAENTWPDTLSTNEVTSGQIQIYPNPTQDLIHIAGASNNAQIKIFNVAGQEIQVHDKRKIQLPQKGIYIINISEHGKNYQFKVIKK
ncbi:MAG: endonuclease [Flavobacteriaceae bacterium]|nr:endonuclease [Flavobacteriaceae bacterium]